MRSPCEVCMEHHAVRPMHEYRECETELGRVGLYLCGPHLSALTVSMARHKQELKGLESLKWAEYMVDADSATLCRVQ